MTNMQSQPSNVMHLGLSLFQHVCKAKNLLPGLSKLAHPRQPQALNFAMQQPGAMQQPVQQHVQQPMQQPMQQPVQQPMQQPMQQPAGGMQVGGMAMMQPGAQYLPEHLVWWYGNAK